MTATREELTREAVRPTDLSTTLAGVESLLRRYVAFPSEHQVVATTLFVAHTHAVDAADSTPYLAITSPEKRSGKTRLLDALEPLVARPWRLVEPSVAVVFRKVERDKPTLMLDEVDTIFRARGENYEGLRGLLNSGHRRGAKVPRCGEKGKTLEEFEVFCPKALAGIGELPDTVADRAIPIRLARRAPGEHVQRFRFREAEAAARPLRESLSAWALGNISTLRNARPLVPSALDDRAEEGWEPLLAIADSAGSDWAERAREAAVALHGDESPQEEPLGVLLLTDTHTVFQGFERVTTADLLAGLVDIEESPWGDWWGKAVEEGDLRGPGRRLATLLSRYGIRSKNLRIGESVQKGYQAEDFTDAWSRYVTANNTLQRNNATPAGSLDQQRSVVTSVASSGGDTKEDSLEEASALITREFDAVEIEQ
jgi:hypothetical protein